MTARFAIVAAVAVLALGAGARPVHADNQYLREARAHKLALDYLAARASLRKAIEQGDNRPAEMAEIFRLGGEIEAGLGNGATAIDYFDRLLAIDPDAILPPGTSPKLAEPFAVAEKRAAARTALTIHHELVAGPALLVVVDADPLHMVAGAAVRYWRRADAEPVVIDAMGQDRIRLPLPPIEGGLKAVLWVFDRYGNHLLELGSGAEPVRLTEAERPPPRARAPGATIGSTAPPPPPRPPLYARWTLWSGVTLASVAAVAYFSLEVRNAEHTLKRLNEDSVIFDYSDAEEVMETGRRDALLANISMAVAGAAAVTTYLLWRRERSRRRDRPAVVVGPVISPGGAGCSVAVEF